VTTVAGLLFSTELMAQPGGNPQAWPRPLCSVGRVRRRQLSCALGVTGNTDTIFDAPDRGNSGVSSAAKAAVDWFGPNDMLAVDTFLREQGCPAEQINHDTAEGFESIYLGGALPTVADKAK
jgi:hypothetical protein